MTEKTKHFLKWKMIHLEMCLTCVCVDLQIFGAKTIAQSHRECLGNIQKILCYTYLYGYKWITMTRWRINVWISFILPKSFRP